jgi:hopene-associated glycosyltransferase HpnB
LISSMVLASLGIWLIILCLPWQPWSTQERLDVINPVHNKPNIDLSAITVLIPARNESAHIVQTLQALAYQGRNFKILVINDESSDATATLALSVGVEGLTVFDGQPPPGQWTGKLWALQQGLDEVTSEFVLLLDADIELKPGLIPTLMQQMAQDRLDFLSLMAELKMETFWECLLVPAFVFFFKLLYPFKLSNDPQVKEVAAAAGGCILVRRSALEAIGGFTAFHEALIDDCTFAQKIKTLGFRTWIGLSRAIVSRRPYARLATFWNMVARTAYSQLRYSPLLLGVCTLLMLICFLVPVLALCSRELSAVLAGMATLLTMSICYLPVLNFYERRWAWALTLPIVGLLFLAMTWTSVSRYYQGERSSWKGRTYKSSLSG